MNANEHSLINSSDRRICACGAGDCLSREEVESIKSHFMALNKQGHGLRMVTTATLLGQR